MHAIYTLRAMLGPSKQGIPAVFGQFCKAPLDFNVNVPVIMDHLPNVDGDSALLYCILATKVDTIPVLYLENMSVDPQAFT